MLQALGLLAGLLSIIMFIPYLRDILRGTTHPQRATWWIWGVLGIIAFFSQLAKGATDSLWFTGAQTAGVLIIAFMAIRSGTGGFSPRDIGALCAAGIGLVAWYFTKEAAFALFIVIAIDAIAFSLTIIKSYQDPESETLSTWILSGTSGLLAALAVGSLNWILLSYPIYILIFNYSTVAAILLGRKRIR